MIKLLRYLLLSFLFVPIILWAATTNSSAQTFQVGKDYELISSANEMTLPHFGNIQVVEFFSYGCPACFRFEPALEKWLPQKPQDVEFERVPVVFEQGWDALAEAFYAAKNLGIAEKMTPIIFDAIHVKGQDLTNEKNLTQLFVQHGVNQQDFSSAFHFSPGIDAQMLRGDNLMRTYKVYQIPTLLIDGKYKTNLGMANGDPQRLIQILDFLIKKEREGR